MLFQLVPDLTLRGGLGGWPLTTGKQKGLAQHQVRGGVRITTATCSQLSGTEDDTEGPQNSRPGPSQP